jgi:hypothetical protein
MDQPVNAPEPADDKPIDDKRASAAGAAAPMTHDGELEKDMSWQAGFSQASQHCS